MRPFWTPLASAVAVSTVTAADGVARPSTLNQSGSVRPGISGTLPSLESSIAPAPTWSASWNFCANGQVPRWTITIAPAGMPS